VAAILRSKALPVITILASAPLFFSFVLKTPPPYLKGYLFVFTWSWGVFGALLAPVCLALECALLIWAVFVKPTPDRGVFVPHPTCQHP
jgi:hypothetical protein